MTADTPPPSALRRDYAGQPGLHRADLAADWVAQFDRWFAEAVEAGLPEPNAMVLATADTAGRPSGRTVLLKGYDRRGLVFYTNYNSRKGAELTANPYASLVFPWHPLHRQVIVCGAVERVGRAETEAYFATRPRDAQLGAWASPQSTVVPDRQALVDRLAAASARFAGRADVPPPPHWGGVRVRPETVEFWQGREGRLHDRLRFRRTGGPAPAGGADEGGWVVERLAP